MTNLKIIKLNYWQTMVKLDDKEVLVEDRWIKSYRESKTYLWISRVVFCTGSLAVLVGFTFLIGIVGRSDYLTEVHLIDDWSVKEYLIRILACTALLGLGGVISYYSNSFKEYYEQKVNYLRRSRNHK